MPCPAAAIEWLEKLVRWADRDDMRGFSPPDTLTLSSFHDVERILTGEVSMSHKFTLGQTVVFVLGGFEVLRAAAVGTITRFLPKDADKYQYHVQIVADGISRRAVEGQGLLPPAYR